MTCCDGISIIDSIDMCQIKLIDMGEKKLQT